MTTTTAGAFIEIKIRDDRSGNFIECKGRDVIKTLRMAERDYRRKYGGGGR